MTTTTAGYAFYFPEDEEGPDDAVPSRLKHIFDAECVAREACKYDYSERNGWERMEYGDSFRITVICPDGTEVQFIGQHEPDVHHSVSEATT